MVPKALRHILLGGRAIDGSNKSKWSTSRARKYAVKEVSNALVSFVATVARLSNYSTTSNADGKKLYFLLGESPSTFSEDDDRFRTFFENRSLSLTVQLRQEVPHILRETVQWWNDEVFAQDDDEERAEVDKEQEAFEENLRKGIAKTGSEFRRRNKSALQELQGEAPQGA